VRVPKHTFILILTSCIVDSAIIMYLIVVQTEIVFGHTRLIIKFRRRLM